MSNETKPKARPRSKRRTAEQIAHQNELARIARQRSNNRCEYAVRVIYAAIMGNIALEKVGLNDREDGKDAILRGVGNAVELLNGRGFFNDHMTDASRVRQLPVPQASKP